MAEFEHNSEQFGYINVEEVEGVQDALTKLGYDPGAVDGKDGPKTEGAVRSFQEAAAINVDGIVGPQTREALVAALERAVTPPAEEASS